MNLGHSCRKNDRFNSMQSHHIGIAAAAALFRGCSVSKTAAGVKHPFYQFVIILYLEADIIGCQIDFQCCTQLLAGLLQALLDMSRLGIQLIQIPASDFSHQSSLFRHNVCCIF